MWQERRKILFCCYTNVASLQRFSNLCLFSVKYCKALHLQASDSYSCDTIWWCGEEKSLFSWTAHMSFTYFNCKEGVTSGTLLYYKGTNAHINMSVCYMIHVTWFYLHWPWWGNVCMYRAFWPTLLTHQSPRCSIHSRGQRERERPQDTLYPLPLLPLSTCFHRNLRRAGSMLHIYPQPMHYAHTAQQEAFMNAHKHDCCNVCESYGMGIYGGMLVSSPHPPLYREKLHRTGVSDGTLLHRALTTVCTHWCGLFETCSYFFSFLPACQSFCLTYLTPKEITFRELKCCKRTWCVKEK